MILFWKTRPGIIIDWNNSCKQWSCYWSYKMSINAQWRFIIAQSSSLLQLFITVQSNKKTNEDVITSLCKNHYQDQVVVEEYEQQDDKNNDNKKKCLAVKVVVAFKWVPSVSKLLMDLTYKLLLIWIQAVMFVMRYDLSLIKWTNNKNTKQQQHQQHHYHYHHFLAVFIFIHDRRFFQNHKVTI